MRKNVVATVLLAGLVLSGCTTAAEVGGRGHARRRVTGGRAAPDGGLRPLLVEAMSGRDITMKLKLLPGGTP